MPQTVKGVIARSKGAPVELADVVVPDPGPGEAVVVVQACGVCHTDLHYREGGINDEFPFLLGHEAAGVVEAVGPGVTDVAPGDFVILNWRAVCGNCRACLKGKPWYCFATHNATQKMTLTDGTVLSPALGIGAFIEKTLVAAGQCTKVSEADAGAVGLLGCGVMAGFGAAVNTGGVHRGDSVAVIGCGGVGNAAIAGAKLVGATTIIAVDVDERKLEGARHFGATHTINSRERDAVEAIRELTGGHGADVVVEAVGRPETYEQAFYARDLAGTVVLVGVPTPDKQVTLPMIEIFGRGGALKSSWYGDCLPSRDFPMLVELYRQGRFPLEDFVSERIGLGDVEAAFEKMHHGEVLRSVVEIAGGPLRMTGMPPTLADVVAALPRSAAGVRVEHLVTSGTFSLDGGTWDVDNNVWILGDDTQCVVIDAPHDAGPILAAIGDRRLHAVLCTHAHDDHVTAALEVCGATGATAYLHPADRVLWDRVHASAPDHDLADGDVLQVGDVEVQVLHTPGHAPGACCFLVPALGVLFSGDTLFNGGPGATGRSFSDFPTIVESIEQRLLSLPADTVVLTGHGDATTIGAEQPHLGEWLARGH